MLCIGNAPFVGVPSFRIFAAYGDNLSTNPFWGFGEITIHVSTCVCKTYALICIVSCERICIAPASQYNIEYPEFGDPMYAIAILRSFDPGGAMHAAVGFIVPRDLQYSFVYYVIT